MQRTPDPLSDGEVLDFSEYRATVSHAVVALDVQSPRPESFRGSLDVGTTGDIHVFDIDADEHSVHRTDSLIARAPQHYFKFTVIERGSGFIVQNGRETALHSGDMAIYDTDRPYSLLFGEAMHMSVVMFPKALLEIPTETINRITALRLDGSQGVGAMVRPFVSSLARSVNAIDGHVARRLFRTAIDMVGTLVEANLPDDTTIGGHDDLVRRILDHIDDHLTSADLSPTSIAAAHYISVRHLHGLFSEQGTTVSTVIRTRRLERCYDELVSPRRNDRSVTAIALDNGFVDPAHFSRTFRSHFGVPPSAVRPA